MSFDSAKLVFAGPVGAGKTTAIRSLSDFEPVSTEMPLTDGPMGEKTTTTVALDFAPVSLEDGTPLHLYGLPGQEHFSHMRPIVMAGAVGVIVVLPGDNARISDECERWLRTIRDITTDAGVVIGITRTDLVGNFRMDTIRDAVRRCGPPVPVFTFDARDREQTSHLVRALLLSLD
ncbi:MAG: hypothetical protein HOP03_01240 [Lysobacter sp.]|nr:hypothetical protein [Lysobacter sp.]